MKMRRIVYILIGWLVMSTPALAQGGLGKNGVRPLVAVKTNLLFDAALAPNIALEVPLCKRLSIAAEYMQPWWHDIARNEWCYQAMYAGGELRMWFCGEKYSDVMPMRGAFVALYGGAGRFDIGWNRKGTQCDNLYTLGVSAGMVHRFSAHWGMEFEMGLGYLSGDTKKYKLSDDGQHLYFDRFRDLRFAGPVRLQLSLVYMLHFQKKGGAE